MWRNINRLFGASFLRIPNIIYILYFIFLISKYLNFFLISIQLVGTFYLNFEFHGVLFFFFFFHYNCLYDINDININAQLFSHKQTYLTSDTSSKTSMTTVPNTYGANMPLEFSFFKTSTGIGLKILSHKYKLESKSVLRRFSSQEKNLKKRNFMMWVPS